VSDAPEQQVPGAGMTPDQFIERIVALRPMIRARQEEADKNGGYTREVHEALLEFGGYAVVRPKRYGGYEFDVPTLLRTVVEMARSDPGSGWCYTFATGHVPIIAGHYSKEAQDEIFSHGSGLALAPLRAPTGGTIRKVEGGYIVDGTWDWGSGMMYATHVMPTARFVGDDQPAGPPTFLLPIIPIEDVEVLWDSWGNGRTLGLQASGSHTFVVKEVFVPERMVTPFSDCQRGGETLEGTLGTRLHGNPLFLGLTTSYFGATIAGCIVGCAWAALDEFETILRSKRTINPPFDLRMTSADYQQPFGEALMYAKGADACMMEYARLYQKMLDDWGKGIPLTAEEDFKLAALPSHASRQASKAVEICFYAGGSSGALAGGRLNRYYRDMAMFRTHPIAQFHTAAIGFAQAHLGLPVPMLEAVGGKRSADKPS
jgi:3-hydroxy-9,10-secoandrosta-1,3,5(10)-triene-9,17-dione monooxygenase